MKVMHFTEEEIADVLQVIAGVLQLGNVNFMAAGGAQVAEKSGMYYYCNCWFLIPYSVRLCYFHSVWRQDWGLVLIEIQQDGVIPGTIEFCFEGGTAARDEESDGSTDHLRKCSVFYNTVVTHVHAWR